MAVQRAWAEAGHATRRPSWGAEASSAQESSKSTSPSGTVGGELAGARRRRRGFAPGCFCAASFSGAGLASCCLNLHLLVLSCALLSEVLASFGSCSSAAALRQSPSAALQEACSPVATGRACGGVDVKGSVVSKPQEESWLERQCS